MTDIARSGASEALTIRDATALVRASDIAAARFQTDVWWRGHPVVGWDLVPSVMRGARPAGYERNITARFLSRAPTRHARCPQRGDWPAWLFLLQHFRLPSRLLDWSESLLVAAFFAVSAHDDQPGSLWALSPYRLNKIQAGTDSLLTPGHSQAAEIFLPPFKRDAPQVDRIVAILAEEVDLRMLVQHAAFTLHGTSTPINRLNDAASALIEFHIPAAAKPHLRESLFRMGVRRASLFPDLENLALDLAALDFVPQE